MPRYTGERGELAAAVVAAAWREEDRASEGFDTGRRGAAAAAGVLDAAIRAVEQRRRVSTAVASDLPLDPEVFDRQTTTDLREFLRHARKGLLTPTELVEEARMWQELLALGWPEGARDTAAVVEAVDLLASLPDAESPPWEPRVVEPANELERAMAATARDEAQRSALWRALHDGELVLPVVRYELIRPEGANFQLVHAPIPDTPLVYGFATGERLDALLPDGAELSRVVPLGRDLPRVWPAGHWLMLNAGYDNMVVLSPWEIASLPALGRDASSSPTHPFQEPMR